MEKTSKILGDLEAIANERVERTLGKVLSIDSMIPLGYRSALCRAARPGFYRQAKHNREFKIYDATVTKTPLKMASSSLSIFSIVMSICLTFES